MDDEQLVAFIALVKDDLVSRHLAHLATASKLHQFLVAQSA
jgi:hypothetical protein